MIFDNVNCNAIVPFSKPSNGVPITLRTKSGALTNLKPQLKQFKISPHKAHSTCPAPPLFHLVPETLHWNFVLVCLPSWTEFADDKTHTFVILIATVPGASPDPEKCQILSIHLIQVPATRIISHLTFQIQVYLCPQVPLFSAHLNSENPTCWAYFVPPPPQHHPRSPALSFPLPQGGSDFYPIWPRNFLN